jgi:hypothetical protein
MTKNGARIRAGISALANRPFEIISGTVVPGSVDSSVYTMSVQKSDGSGPIEGVMLNPLTGDAKGFVLVPADGSSVVIASIDGPGEWVLIRASEITKAIITIESVVYEINSSEVNIQNGNVVLNIGTSVFKMKTAGESLFGILNDLITALTVLTVTTSSGTSSVPVNVATFTTLAGRLSNLLSA